MSGAFISRGNLTERHGSMTTGGTSKQLMAENANRRYLLIENPTTAAGQNIATAEKLYVRFGSAAAGVDNATSLEIAPGGSYTVESNFVPTDAIQVNASTTSHRWLAWEG